MADRPQTRTPKLIRMQTIFRFIAALWCACALALPAHAIDGTVTGGKINPLPIAISPEGNQASRSREPATCINGRNWRKAVSRR